MQPRITQDQIDRINARAQERAQERQRIRLAIARINACRPYGSLEAARAITLENLHEHE